MCGIAGWIGQIKEDRDQLANRMVNCMIHRGPDQQNVKHFDNVTLIHNRLKIIDLSDAGSQPMKNDDESVWIVFNGEIYNYREQRSALQQKGYHFKSQSDTEVLIHLYKEYGTDMLKYVKGMFAFTIYDTNTQRVFIARDRYGIKPLFIYHSKDSIAFASEINTLKQLKNIDLRINTQAIYDYLSFLYIPSPLTLYQNIFSVEPGQYYIIDLAPGKLHVDSGYYYTSNPTIRYDLTENDVLKRTEALLSKSVSQQLVSDVPVGAFLSGGIDSSLICAFAQKQLTYEKLNTYNVQFPDKLYDETWAAVAVANHIHSNHHTLNMDMSGASVEYIEQMLSHAGQPFADTSYFATNRISSLMRNNATVVLSGDGGDEGFGGYDIYKQLPNIIRFNHLPSFIQNNLYTISSLLKPVHSSFSYYNKVIGQLKNIDSVSLMEELFSWIKKEEKQRLWNGNLAVLPTRRYFEAIKQKISEKNKLEELSLFATQFYVKNRMPNDYLFKVDTASMKESIEVRVPFLDEELFEFGISLPYNLKIKHGQSKYVLRKLAKNYLPSDIIKKGKWGFGLPVDKWLPEKEKERIWETYANKNLEVYNYINYDECEKWLSAFCSGKNTDGISRQGLYQRVVMLMALQIHLR
jgi:asparagine synthase (glutamine-hydrolysing)